MRLNNFFSFLHQRVTFNGFGLLRGILCVIALFSCVQLISTTGLTLLLRDARSQVSSHEQQLARQRAMDEARIGLLNASDLLNRAGVWFMQDKETGSVGSWNSLADDATHALAASQTAFQQFVRLSGDDKTNSALAQSYQLFYGGLKEQVDGLKSTNSIDGFFAVPIQAFQAQFNDDFVKYKAASDKESQLATQQLVSGLNQAQSRSLGALGLLLLVALGTWWSVLRWVIRPLRGLIGHLDSLAAGDLSRLPSVPPRYNHEITDLHRSMVTMQQGLRQLVDEVRDATEAMAQHITRLDNDNQTLAKHAGEQNRMLDSVATHMESLSGHVEENTSHARQANKRADEAREIARSGDEMMATVSESMQDIVTRSDEMRGIVSLIGNVAFQTNILALNAAIEAAHAGSHGRGFAVVAKEVGVLAQKSSHSTRNIQQLIHHSLEGIAEGSRAVSRLGGNLQQVNGLVGKLTSLLNDIASASLSQGESIHQVTERISALNKVAGHTDTLVQQARGASQDLYEGSLQLTEAVSRFRLV